tara:strand:+ start:6627 stop:6818 length:192 start_codon:yes stop_codon:yes gene_type:complete
MSSLHPRQRFEITFQSEGQKLKHVCAAHEEAEAVDRIMRSYKTHNPDILSVKRLGVLPMKLKR